MTIDIEYQLGYYEGGIVAILGCSHGTHLLVSLLI